MNVVEALDEVTRIVTTTPRRRSPLEAPSGFTNAYVGLVLAYGYARIGESARARSFAVDCRTPLLDQLGDPIHAYLVATFDARIDQALRGSPAGAALPETSTAALLRLHRAARYKVDRLREQSTILAPLDGIDAARTWFQHRESERDTLLRVALPERPDAIANMLDIVASDEDRREALLDCVFNALATLEPGAVSAHLPRAIELVGKLHVPHQPRLYARAMCLADLASLPALTFAAAVAIRSTLEHADAAVLEHAVPRLCRTEHRDVLTELLATRGIPTDVRAGLAIAGSLAWLGDLAGAEPLLARGWELGRERLRLPSRLDLTRALAMACSRLPPDRALVAIVKLGAGFQDITDSYGSNSHFTASVVVFVEALVLGVIGTIGGAERGLHRRSDE